VTPQVALAFRKEERAEPYRAALRMAGLEPVSFVPGTGAGSLAEVGGLVLSGGTDVDPALYGEKPHPETQKPLDPKRDAYEIALTREALATGKPVLAICRGIQLLNVALGGSLVQHLETTERHRKPSGGEPVHFVELGGPMERILAARTIPVNSRHHQAVGRVAEGLVVTALDPEDGVIEGVVLPGSNWVVGVQWHPEDMTEDPVQMGLFTAFRRAVARISSVLQ
jgi:gamma-glutamyl-gamma-aminobutyrate hydrolase PuuD